MTIVHLIIIALVQGITEFLPISSSAHLILAPEFANLPDQGPLIDIAVHVGTLGAVMVYFRRDVKAMARGAWAVVVRRQDRDPATAEGARLVAIIAAATVPVVLGGALVAAMGWQDPLRNVTVIGWTTLVFGILLYVVDRRAGMARKFDSLGWGPAVTIGLAQVLALVPGTSRSGVTMTAARALGFSRTAAAHFSMLLSIPTILAAGSLAAIEIYRGGNIALGLDALIAAVLSFVTALAAIALLMRWLMRASFTPFVIYRVILGLGLLWWSYA